MSGKVEIASMPDTVRYWHSGEDAFRAIQKAVCDALHTDVRGDALWRKLSHVRFLGTVLKNFVDRLTAYDECGKLASIAQLDEEWARRVARLRAEHRTLVSELNTLLHMMEFACASDIHGCEEVFESLTALVARIEAVMRHEADLVDEAFAC